jgi:AraC family transcriptional regulator, positive regulator of tynA and feaB
MKCDRQHYTVLITVTLSVRIGLRGRVRGQEGRTLQSVRGLRLADYSLDEQEAYWQRGVTEQLVPMSIRLASHDPNKIRVGGVLEHKAVADLTLARWDCPPSEGTRARAQIRRADPETIIVIFVAQGTERISHGDGATALSRESMLVCSSATPVHFATDGNLRKRSLIVPRMVFEGTMPNLAVGDGIRLSTSKPAVRLLRDYLGMLWSGAEEMSAESCVAARDATVSLVAGAITAEIEPLLEGAAPALRMEMIRWIDQHLSAGPIRVTELASAHYVSERTVQRVFEMAAETVNSVVRRRRMFHARADLLSTSHAIVDVATRWGYYDSSHFSREFRYYYDCTPGEYRAEHAWQSRALPV